MKKIIFAIALVLSGCLNAFSQATSLTIDNQTPGWLSSKINYGDQLTLKNLKVTGYINGTDIQFIYDLNSLSLTGVIDLEDVSIVKGGTLSSYPSTLEKDNEMPVSLFGKQKKHIQKFVYPKTLVKAPINPFPKSGMVDSLIWTSTNVKGIYITSGVGNAKYIYIPEGIEEVGNIAQGTHITFPNTIKNANINKYSTNTGVTIYSFIKEPEMVKATYEYYTSSTGQRYFNAYKNCTFYIPKGTMSKYLKSEFATLNAYDQYNVNLTVPNGNTFIEYYDIDSTEVIPNMTLYKGESEKLNVTIKPDLNLVSWIDYISNDTQIVTIDSEGNITAKNYGQAEVSATPHVFIDGLETKTGTCVVNVLAHVEGVDMQESMSLHIGEMLALNAHTLPLEITDNKICYESSDPSIAVVNEQGLVSGKKKGVCTVTATSIDGGYTATCEITVTQPVETLTLEMHSTNLKVGDKKTLYAQITPAIADNKTIKWSSLDEQIASVDESGVVTALKAGKANIKAESVDNPEAYDICEVIVIQPVLGITLSHDKITLDNEEKIQLTALIEPDDATEMNVRWSSSNENVCVINNGLVTAVAPGQATITVTTVDGGYTATCIVKVLQHVTKVDLGKATLSLKVGDTERLSVIVSPDNADDKTINWLSSDEQVAIVDENGNITALKVGNTTIKAESVDNSEAYAICEVFVLQPTTGISLNMQKCTLTSIGESAELEATVSPEDASNKNVKWKSSDESVCIVANGTVVAVGSGVCVIIATSEDGGHMATCTVTVSIYDGVKGVEGAESVTIESISDAAGRRINSLQRGLNILRMNDGTTKKVMVK